MICPRLVLALAFLFLMSCGQHDFADFLEKGKNPSSSSGKEEEEADDGICSMVKEDGTRYRTVEIGTQTWFAENLNCNVEGSKCYNDDPANCEIYGRLYDWIMIMDFPSSCYTTACASLIQAKHRGICPQGWHIPTDPEWTILINYVDGVDYTGRETEFGFESRTAGIKLKATSGWNDHNGASGNGTDDYGFAALPNGENARNQFFFIGSDGYWWSSTEYSSAEYDVIRVGGLTMFSSGGLTRWGRSNMKYGFFGVRCLKD